MLPLRFRGISMLKDMLRADDWVIRLLKDIELQSFSSTSTSSETHKTKWAVTGREGWGFNLRTLCCRTVQNFMQYICQIALSLTFKWIGSGWLTKPILGRLWHILMPLLHHIDWSYWGNISMSIIVNYYTGEWGLVHFSPQSVDSMIFILFTSDIISLHNNISVFKFQKGISNCKITAWGWTITSTSHDRGLLLW